MLKETYSDVPPNCSLFHFKSSKSKQTDTRYVFWPGCVEQCPHVMPSSCYIEHIHRRQGIKWLLKEEPLSYLLGPNPPFTSYYLWYWLSSFLFRGCVWFLFPNKPLSLSLFLSVCDTRWRFCFFSSSFSSSHGPVARSARSCDVFDFIRDEI